MKRFVCAIALFVFALVQTACGSDRYSVEVGPVATPAPTAQPAPTAAPQIIIVQQPAPAPPAAISQPQQSAADVVLVVVLLMVALLAAAGVGALGMNAVRREPSPPPAPTATYLPPYPVPDEPPLLNVVNHYHYHPAPPPAGAPEMPPPPTLPGSWSIHRKATWLINAGYTVDEARAILDRDHQARQLPPAK